MTSGMIALGIAGVLALIVLQSIGTAIGLVIHQRVKADALIAVAVVIVVAGAVAVFVALSTPQF